MLSPAELDLDLQRQKELVLLAELAARHCTNCSACPYVLTNKQQSSSSEDVVVVLSAGSSEATTTAPPPNSKRSELRLGLAALEPPALISSDFEDQVLAEMSAAPVALFLAIVKKRRREMGERFQLGLLKNLSRESASLWAEYGEQALLMIEAMMSKTLQDTEDPLEHLYGKEGAAKFRRELELAKRFV